MSHKEFIAHDQQNVLMECEAMDTVVSGECTNTDGSMILFFLPLFMHKPDSDLCLRKSQACHHCAITAHYNMQSFWGRTPWKVAFGRWKEMRGQKILNGSSGNWFWG